MITHVSIMIFPTSAEIEKKTSYSEPEILVDSVLIVTQRFTISLVSDIITCK